MRRRRGSERGTSLWREPAPSGRCKNLTLSEGRDRPEEYTACVNGPVIGAAVCDAEWEVTGIRKNGVLFASSFK